MPYGAIRVVLDIIAYYLCRSRARESRPGSGVWLCWAQTPAEGGRTERPRPPRALSVRVAGSHPLDAWTARPSG